MMKKWNIGLTKMLVLGVGLLAVGCGEEREPGPCVYTTVYESGRVDTNVRLSYDEQGNVTRKEIDWNGDKVVDDVHTMTYNDRGDVITESVDNDGDGGSWP